jgi:hypothetical protein
MIMTTSAEFAKWALDKNAYSLDPTIFHGPVAGTAMSGLELVKLHELGLYPTLAGAEGGYVTEGDVVQTTSDGTDLNAMWAEFQATLDIYNSRRSGLVALLTYPVQQLIEDVPQMGESTFEEASEFGEPKGQRAELAYFQLAYDFRDYDLATRFTWKALRDLDQRQVEALHQQALTADNRLIFKKVMEAIWNKPNRSATIKRQNYTVFSLYNGDGAVPPSYKDITFDGTHSHYMTSGAAVIDSDDLEDAYENIAHHGYGIENGTTFVALMNREQIKEVRKFRAGVVNNNSAEAAYDFIPAPGQPAMIVPNSDGLLGSQPQSSWNGLPVIGSYAGILIVEEGYIPDGYFLMFGTGGDGDLQNIVGLREHANPAYRGLRLLPGNQARYPLVDSYYSRGFGTGIRQRGGAVVMMLGGDGTSATYTAPTKYANNGILVA